jgi:hypothetical protein
VGNFAIDSNFPLTFYVSPVSVFFFGHKNEHDECSLKGSTQVEFKVAQFGEISRHLVILNVDRMNKNKMFVFITEILRDFCAF